MDDIDQVILAYFSVKQTTAGAVNGETRLLECGILDSLELMSLVTYVEEHYGFHLPEQEYVPENFRTPATIAKMVRKSLAGCGLRPCV